MENVMRRKEEKKMTLAEREERIMRAEECVRAHDNREALALFRIMRETGIRMNDLRDLAPENMNGRELLVVESKYKGKGWYRNANGSYPVISDGTWAMLTPGEDGKYFHHSREYYVGLFRKVIEDKEFRYYELRRFVVMQKLKFWQKK
jgi:hypothetical protein